MANISSINGNPIVVGTSGIADGSVTADKLSGNIEVTPLDGSVTTSKISDGSVTVEKMSDNALALLDNRTLSDGLTLPRCEFYWKRTIRSASFRDSETTICTMVRLAHGNFVAVANGHTVTVCSFSTASVSSISGYVTLGDGESVLVESGTYYAFVILSNYDKVAYDEHDGVLVYPDPDESEFLYERYKAPSDRSYLATIKELENEGAIGPTDAITRSMYVSDAIGYMKSVSANSGVIVSNRFMYPYDVLVRNASASSTPLYVISDSYGTVTPLATYETMTIQAGIDFYLYKGVSSVDNLALATHIQQLSYQAPYDGSVTEHIVNYDLTRKRIRSLQVRRSAIGRDSALGTQDSDQYGGYIVTAGTHNTELMFRNVETDVIDHTCILKSGNFGHANTLSFSSQFYDGGDAFPLLLVSDWYESVLHVVRIDPSYNASIVNSISITCTGEGSVGFVYDRHANVLYSLRWDKDDDSRTGLHVGSLSAVFDFVADEAYTMTQEFFVDMRGMLLQGACAYNGYVFMAVNSAGDGYATSAVYVIDSASKTICDKITSFPSAFSGVELEGIWIDPATYAGTTVVPVYVMRQTTHVMALVQE